MTMDILGRGLGEGREERGGGIYLIFPPRRNWVAYSLISHSCELNVNTPQHSSLVCSKHQQCPHGYHQY